MSGTSSGLGMLMILLGSPIAVIGVPFYTGEDVSRRKLSERVEPRHAQPIAGEEGAVPDLMAVWADPDMTITVISGVTTVVPGCADLTLYLGRPHGQDPSMS